MYLQIYKIVICDLLIMLLSCSKITDNGESEVNNNNNESENTEWNLVWEDDFNRDDIFSTKDWRKIKRVKPTPAWMTNISDYEGCYDLIDGKAILRGLNNEYLPEDTAKFLCGGITTKGTRYFKNGLIEVRAKLQAAKSAWPAIWLMPIKGGWPEAGEIDIMERLHYNNFVEQTLHSYYIDKLGIKNPSHQSKVVIDPEIYNVYAVELGTDTVKFYVNNKLTLTYPRLNDEYAIANKQFPYDNEWFLLIDMQIGAPWMVPPPDPKEMPIEMAIDWVRFYQK